MGNQTEQIAQLIDATTGLKIYFENSRDDIESRVSAKELQVQHFLDDAKLRFPFINLIRDNIFTLENQTWPGYTHSENGFGTGNGHWNYTEEFIRLSDGDSIAQELIDYNKLSRFTLTSWFYRKLVITNVGTDQFNTGLHYSSAGLGRVTGGFLVKVNDGPWIMTMQSRTSEAVHQGDWGATYSLSERALGDVIYIALPFICTGQPSVVPFPKKFISILI